MYDTPDGTKVNYYYDWKTGLKIKQVAEVPNATVMEWTDYRDIDGGIKIPFSEKTTVVGLPMELKVKAVNVNTGLPDDLFKVGSGNRPF